MKRMEGKIALVTGAASGIGAASAKRLAEEGATTVGMDVADPSDPAWDDASRAAPAAIFEIGDVSVEADVARVVAATIQAHGRIDAVVNAAGVAGGGAAHTLELEEFNRVLAVNLTGTLLVSKHALAGMLETGGGSIVNIASVEGLEGTEGGSAYNASKGGVVLLTKNMAIDYGRRGIRVNAVCPGFIATPMLRSVFGEGMEEYLARVVAAHQLGRLGEASEIAAAVAFLASDDASFVSGHSLVVDGGLTAGHRFGFTELMGLA